MQTPYGTKRRTEIKFAEWKSRKAATGAECLQGVARRPAYRLAPAGARPEVVRPGQLNLSERLQTGFELLRSSWSRPALPFGSSPGKLAYPCFRTGPSSACSKHVQPDSDVHWEARRPLQELPTAAKPPVSAQIGARTSWQVQFYIHTGWVAVTRRSDREFGQYNICRFCARDHRRCMF